MAQASIDALIRMRVTIDAADEEVPDHDAASVSEVTEALTTDFPWIETLEPQMDGPTLAVPEEADPGSEAEEGRFMAFLRELFERDESAFWCLVLPDHFDEQAAEFYC